MLPALIATVNFLLSTKKVKIQVSDGFNQCLNLYMILVGPPSSGKSPAIKDAVLDPLQQIDDDLIQQTVISNITLSGTYLPVLLSLKHN